MCYDKNLICIDYAFSPFMSHFTFFKLLSYVATKLCDRVEGTPVTRIRVYTANASLVMILGDRMVTSYRVQQGPRHDRTLAKESK